MLDMIDNLSTYLPFQYMLDMIDNLSTYLPFQYMLDMIDNLSTYLPFQLHVRHDKQPPQLIFLFSTC